MGGFRYPQPGAKTLHFLSRRDDVARILAIGDVLAQLAVPARSPCGTVSPLGPPSTANGVAAQKGSQHKSQHLLFGKAGRSGSQSAMFIVGSRRARPTRCVTSLAWAASGGRLVPFGFAIETCRQASSLGRARGVGVGAATSKIITDCGNLSYARSQHALVGRICLATMSQDARARACLSLFGFGPWCACIAA